MVGWKHYHQNANPHDLHLHLGRGWQDNPDWKHEQKQDVCSLQDKEEIPQCQVHPRGKTDKTIRLCLTDVAVFYIVATIPHSSSGLQIRLLTTSLMYMNTTISDVALRLLWMLPLINEESVNDAFFFGKKTNYCSWCVWRSYYIDIKVPLPYLIL